jgi:hypothetical protein
MRFADPHVCPDCRGAIAGQSTCPHCHLDLSSTEVRQLWQTLLQADELLERATQRRDHSAAPKQPSQPVAAAPAVAPPPTPAQSDPYAQYPAQIQHPPPRKERKERKWSVGTILLVLGAFGLIVAGLIFVTRSWEDIGLAGRTLILLGVTAVMGLLGAWVTRRPLRASAEAVWTVFLALLTLDFFAARHEGLAGLDALEIDWAWVVWGVISLALGVGIAVWARKPVGADLIAPAVVGGLGITIAGIGAGAVVDDWDFAWQAIVALVVAGLLALSTRPAGLKPMTLAARIVFAGFFIAAFVAAFFELIDNPGLHELVQDGHGYPMLIMAIASLVVAWLVKLVRTPAVALAVVAACALVITPSADAWDPEGVWLSLAGLAVVLVIAGARGTSDWMRGVRLGAVPVVGGIVLLHVGLLFNVFETLDPILNNPWKATWDDRLDVGSVENYATWTVPIVVAALLVVAWMAPRWPELGSLAKHATSVVAGAAALGAIDAVVAMRLPVWGSALTLLVVAAALLVAQTRGLATYAGPAAAVVVAAASALAAASPGVSATTWIAGAAILIGLALAKGDEILRQAYAALAVLLGLGGVAATVELLDVRDAVTPMVVLISALGVMAAASLLFTEHVTRLPLEGAAALGGFAALLHPASSSELAVRWTVVGVALIALGFAVKDRRWWYVWPGAFALVIAYILLIVDSGFSFVEAYTLPLGAVALAAGTYAAVRKPDISTWVVLGPGLALALLPSVPQALADPTHLRALLLGLGAVVALLTGIKLGWQAPFVTGVGIVTLLVLFNIGPYANAAPRVVVIAIVSAILLGVGITWEDRVRDGRKLVGYVRSMR